MHSQNKWKIPKIGTILLKAMACMVAALGWLPHSETSKVEIKTLQAILVQMSQ